VRAAKKTVHVVESNAPLHAGLWAQQAADAAAKHVYPWPTLERELPVPPGLPAGPPPDLTRDTVLPPLPSGPPTTPPQPHDQPASQPTAEPLLVRRGGRVRRPPERHDPTPASRTEQCADQEARCASAASANLHHHTRPVWCGSGSRHTRAHCTVAATAMAVRLYQDQKSSLTAPASYAEAMAS
jgi:hypothetical protein